MGKADALWWMPGIQALQMWGDVFIFAFIWANQQTKRYLVPWRGILRFR